MLSSGWFGEREVAPAWYGGAPSFVALHVGAVGLRASGRLWSRPVAPGGSGRVGGAVANVVRLSCLSEDAGGLLRMVDFTTVRVKAAPLRSALFCCAKTPSGLDASLREVGM